MNSNNLFGMPENIIIVSEDNTFDITTDKLKENFEHPMVKDRQIAVLAVVGASRKGKSFFLNYCLRFLYSNYASIKNPGVLASSSFGWIGKEDESLNGFSWRGGSVLDTKGIVFWNDIFIHPNDNIAIVVADTQGLFSNEFSPMDNSRIFALGIMISSILVLNSSGVIQEDHLQNLQHTIELAKFSINYNESDEKPFQKLTFLIRDWNALDNYEFGINGGKKYIDVLLNRSKSQKEELKSVCWLIQNSFENLECCLLPCPGKLVTGVTKKSDKTYDGNYGDMDQDFRDEFFRFIEYLLKPENINPKRINESVLTGSDFLRFINNCYESIQSNLIPKVKSDYESLVEKQVTDLVQFCMKHYKESFHQYKNYGIDISEVFKQHQNCKENTLALYDGSIEKVNIDSEDQSKFKNILKKEIDIDYEEYKLQWEQIKKKIEEENQNVIIDVEEQYKPKREQIKIDNRMIQEHNQQEMLKLKQQIEQERQLKEKLVEDIRIQYDQKCNEIHQEMIRTPNINDQIEQVELDSLAQDNSFEMVGFREHFNNYENDEPGINFEKLLERIENIINDREKRFIQEIEHIKNETELIKEHDEQKIRELEKKIEDNRLSFEKKFKEIETREIYEKTENQIKANDPIEMHIHNANKIEEKKVSNIMQFRLLKKKIGELEERNSELRKLNQSLEEGVHKVNIEIMNERDAKFEAVERCNKLEENYKLLLTQINYQLGLNLNVNDLSASLQALLANAKLYQE